MTENVGIELGIMSNLKFNSVTKNLVVLLAIFLVSGCAYHQAPHITYSDMSTPLDQTAVLVAWDNSKSLYSGGLPTSGVANVDGNITGILHGFPLWVRVTPGTHSFKLIYVLDARPGFNEVVRTEAHLNFTVEDMKAGHIYYTHYKEENGEVHAYIEDLGPNAKFGMRLCGIYGDCKTLHYVKF